MNFQMLVTADSGCCGGSINIMRAAGSLERGHGEQAERRSCVGKHLGGEEEDSEDDPGSQGAKDEDGGPRKREVKGVEYVPKHLLWRRVAKGQAMEAELRPTDYPKGHDQNLCELKDRNRRAVTGALVRRELALLIQQRDLDRLPCYKRARMRKSNSNNANLD